MINYKTLFDLVGNEISFEKKLKGSSCLIFLVKDNNSKYILKARAYETMSHKDHDWGKTHIEKEVEILNAAKDIKGITHIIRECGISNDHIAILKEYSEGQTLKKHGKLNNIELKKQLETTINEIHDLGYAYMDIHPKNIIVGYNEEHIKIIDLGSCIASNEVSSFKFNNFKKQDFKDLKELYSYS